MDLVWPCFCQSQAKKYHNISTKPDFRFYANARAELYHGIDIDAVYESSDWSSKEKIKELIDDYIFI